MGVKSDYVEINAFKYVQSMNNDISESITNVFCDYWRDEIVDILQKYLSGTEAKINSDGYDLSVSTDTVFDKIELVREFIGRLRESVFYEYIADLMPISIGSDMVEWR